MTNMTVGTADEDSEMENGGIGIASINVYNTNITTNSNSADVQRGSWVNRKKNRPGVTRISSIREDQTTVFNDSFAGFNDSFAGLAVRSGSEIGFSESKHSANASSSQFQSSKSLVNENACVAQYLTSLRTQDVKSRREMDRFRPLPTPKVEQSDNTGSNGKRSTQRYSMAQRSLETEVTYPADCFSFLILYGPIKHPYVFGFSCGVFLMQFSLLLCAILSVVHPILNTMGETDNPSKTGVAFFIPANVSSLVRATQILAVLTYVLFADSSVKDVITSVETFPRYCKKISSDNYRCMVFSCVLRFVQGCMTVLATFLLIVKSTDVMDIILDFMAMNFVSNIAKVVSTSDDDDDDE